MNLRVRYQTFSNLKEIRFFNSDAVGKFRNSPVSCFFSSNIFIIRISLRNINDNFRKVRKLFFARIRDYDICKNDIWIMNLTFI